LQQNGRGSITRVAAVETCARRAANDTSLVALAVLLEAHGFAASAANFVRNGGLSIGTDSRSLELRIEGIWIALQDDPNGFFAQLFMRLVVCARITVAKLGARNTRGEALAVSV